MKKISREDALEYHARGRKGKIQVVPTKPTASQWDLSLAYSPGVAYPCKEIERDPLLAYQYTAKGNLVAVISNGTAVLGLGNIGALAGKPVMEGKGVLFKRFADIDVFDLEIATTDPEELIRTVKLLEPTFGGINLEDIRAPDCFEIERRLKAEMSIPVFHDDQHGTAIISGAALLNALELTGKPFGDVRIVFSGAGAAALSCAKLYMKLGARRENIIVCDSHGVIYAGRTERMDRYKQDFAVETGLRTLTEALVGADVFIGLSVAGVVTPDMVRSMARDPIVFAMANPDPEINYDEARAARPDVIVATGRSDYPNQVNNVLGFPFIFRGALDVRATDINDAMELAAVQALAGLAREDVPDSVLKAYGLDTLGFSREYLIPKPIDHRVLLRVPPAVAKAAMETGVARVPIEDFDAYRRRLETLISRRFELMRGIIDRAKRAPKRVVFPEGEHDKILRAAKILVDEGIAHPILLARRDVIADRLRALDLPESRLTIIHAETCDRFEGYAQRFHELRRRDGMTLEEAHKWLRLRNYFGSMMVEEGDADGLISGLTQSYPETIRPALQIIDTRPGVRRVCGAYILIVNDRIFFLADTTVNIDPTPEELAEIALLTVELARRFGVEPRVAMLSFSNFGSNKHPAAQKVRRATEIVSRLDPALEVDGEMQADTAVFESILHETYPWSRLKEPANVLVFPELQSANIAYKLIWRLAGAEAVGPILLGMGRPVHVLQSGLEVSDIVNMTALCVVDAQEREEEGQRTPAWKTAAASE
ncbi:MAG TPA: NADP-dependent malic enzyme [Thermoanaerobaculia bacterium]|jgi:malate dehydrogenase (oxaloacetate-decarboxylating)(NADP+)|nr:NADP-dependent malic enzyme [Thermoanaerobaculia bacterium]